MIFPREVQYSTSPHAFTFMTVIINYIDIILLYIIIVIITKYNIYNGDFLK
jgi:hypothetical protein